MTEDKLRAANETRSYIISAESTYELIENSTCIRINDGMDEIPIMNEKLDNIRQSLLDGLSKHIQKLNLDFDKI